MLNFERISLELEEADAHALRLRTYSELDRAPVF